MYIQIILFIVSLVFYFESPDKYSLPFCTAVFGVFLVSSVLFLRKTFKNRNYFNFHIFFLLSIFFTNFAYPVFIYPTDPEYFSIFTFAFDHNIISQGTALSQLAVSSYILGVTLVKLSKKNVDVIEYEYSFSPGLVKLLHVLAVFFTLGFIGHVIYMFKFEPDEETLNTQIVNFCVIIFSIAILVNNQNDKNELKNNILFFLKMNKMLLFCGAAIILFSLWFGDRGPAIEMFFIFMFIFVHYVSKIKLRVFIPMIIFGLFIMTMISYTRGGDSNLKSGSIGNTLNQASEEMGEFGSFWNYGMDLIVNNRNLFVALEIGNNKELLYGKSYFPYLFAPIPGIPTVLTENILGEKPEYFATSTIITKYTGLDWGVGSNAVGDIYMNFGTYGVVGIFFLFGIFIARLEFSNSIYGLLSFTLIFALVIYYPRSSLLEQLSLVVRGIIILFLIFVFTNNPKSIKKFKSTTTDTL
ncbi:MAG: O-antigen polysaccharide polymerase Wzy family protein [Flavobacteriales bacterium]|nr:O-antigen polysaccharide polymerase Wzy family protein [Flavobacteriales bacterium]